MASRPNKHGNFINLAVIPARGGSKRIPHKNIRIFIDRPIIAYSIQKAQQSGLFDKIIVSTDDPEIVRVAEEFGADTPFVRPASLSDDFTGTDAVIKHAIEWFFDKGQCFDYVCGIYATAPMMQIDHLVEGYNRLVTEKKHFALGVTSYPHPVQRGLRLTNEGIEPYFKGHITDRSQDLEPIYHDTGQFYWGTPEAFVSETQQFSKISIPVYIPRYLVQDIDTLEDWVHAEAMYMALESLGKIKPLHASECAVQISNSQF